MKMLQTFSGTTDSQLARRICVVHLNIVIYAFAYWLTQPIFPFLSKDLGADMILFGYLQTFLSVLQLIGGPIVGRLCDSKGPRIALIMSQFAATLNYGFLALATNVPMLFGSQLPTLFMHCMHAAQSSITLMSTDKARATSLGRLSLSYGIGMIMGSLLGGYLGESMGYPFVAMLAAGSSFLTIPLNLQFLPHGAEGVKEESGLGLSMVVKLLGQPNIRDLIILQFLVGLSISVYRSTFSQALRLRFELSPQYIGQFMSFGAITSVCCNVFLVPVFTKRWSDFVLMRMAIGLLCLCFLVYSMAHTLILLIGLSVPLSIASSLVYTLFSSTMTKVVKAEDSGTSIGLSHATRTLCGIISPTLAGYLFQDLGYSSLGIFGAILAGIAAVYAFVMPTGKEEPSKSKED